MMANLIEKAILHMRTSKATPTWCIPAAYKVTSCTVADKKIPQILDHQKTKSFSIRHVTASATAPPGKLIFLGSFQFKKEAMSQV